MRKTMLMVLAAGMMTAAGAAQAQQAIGLDQYVDAKGFVDIEKLTCAQLANTYQEDANVLAGWLSGWYNGLAKKHYYHYTRTKGEEHKLIVYCKAHQDERLMNALDKIFKAERDAN